MARFSVGSAFKIRGRKSYGLRGWKGKPFHPPLTDIPVAAYIIAPVLDVIAFVAKSKDWAPHLNLAAGYVLLGGAGVSLLTALTGFMDWLDTEAGTPIRRVANTHMLTMITVTLMVLGDLGWRFLTVTHDRTSVGVMILSIAIGVLTFLGSTIGGTMVYDYGFNVATAGDHPVYHKDTEPAAGESSAGQPGA
jgi:uncharacterized membrane protein